MTDIGSSVVLASLVVGMLSIPAASQTIDTPETVTGSMPNVSSSDSVPKDVSTSTSAEEFSRKVESAFGEFSLSIMSGSATASVQDPGSSFDVYRSPGKTTWEVVTPDGSLKITEKPSKVVKVVETSQGTLKTVRDEGNIRKTFEGVHRAEVEETAERLRSLMEKRKQQLERKRNRLVRNHLNSERYSNSLEIDVKEESPEHVVITNSLSVPVRLEDWKLSNNNPDTHVFSSTEIPAEGKLKAFSGDRSELSVDEKESVNYVYGTDLSWENTGDTAKLENPDGEVIEKESYGS